MGVVLLTLDKNVEKGTHSTGAPGRPVAGDTYLAQNRENGCGSVSCLWERWQGQESTKPGFREERVPVCPDSTHPYVCPQRSPETTGLSTPHQPIHYPVFPGEACLPLCPSQHPSREHSPTSPIATNSCDSESYFQGNQKKKKKSQHQGKFQPQSNGSRGISSRMQLWARSSRDRCKQDLSPGVRTGKGSG